MACTHSYKSYNHIWQENRPGCIVLSSQVIMALPELSHINNINGFLSPSLKVERHALVLASRWQNSRKKYLWIYFHFYRFYNDQA